MIFAHVTRDGPPSSLPIVHRRKYHRVRIEQALFRVVSPSERYHGANVCVLATVLDVRFLKDPSSGAKIYELHPSDDFFTLQKTISRSDLVAVFPQPFVLPRLTQSHAHSRRPPLIFRPPSGGTRAEMMQFIP